MNLPPLLPVAWLALLIALPACRESAAHTSWRGSSERLPSGAEPVAEPSVGLWGDSDGWSVITQARFGSLESQAPERVGELRGPHPDSPG